MALGDDVQETTLRFHIAFKRIKNFACIEFRPTTGKILIFVKVDPATVALETGVMRDVSNVGHFGTGDLEITLHLRSGGMTVLCFLPIPRSKNDCGISDVYEVALFQNSERNGSTS
jgi:predicted transport protein